MSRAKRQHLSLPQRWLNCPNIGNVINQLFVPFKTPLDEQYDSEMSISDRFHLKTLLTSTNAQHISLIINLTKTDRYYDSNILQSYKIGFKKIACEGHEGPPTEDQVKNFINICFNHFNANDDSHIGVHCTHGFNRTGFMIVAYLCDQCDCDLQDAVDFFAAARPPGIYKQDYLDELVVRYGDNEKLIAPERPDWCSENVNFKLDSSPKFSNNNKETFNLSDSEDENENSKPRKIRKKFDRPKKTPVFMSGVSGITPVTDEDEANEIISQVCELMKSKRNGFPGSQPVSMTRENIELLLKNNYMVSWKADGTRYMMFIADKGMVYMFDRSECVFEVNNLNFPKTDDDYHKLTLIDGEMVIDDYQGKKIPRYLIYDIMTLNGDYVGNKPFIERLGLIKKQIIDPRNKYVNPNLKKDESFGVRMKDFWPIEKTHVLWDGNFKSQLCHEMDGLIFQPSGPQDFYVQGKCETALKWKPPNLNSIDFVLTYTYKVEKESLPEYIGFLKVDGDHRPFGVINNIKKDIREKYNNKIVECTFNTKTGQWHILRERTDKLKPNYIETAKSVFKSITEPVHISDVYQVIKRKLRKK